MKRDIPPYPFIYIWLSIIDSTHLRVRFSNYSFQFVTDTILCPVWSTLTVDMNSITIGISSIDIEADTILLIMCWYLNIDWATRKFLAKITFGQKSKYLHCTTLTVQIDYFMTPNWWASKLEPAGHFGYLYTIIYRGQLVCLLLLLQVNRHGYIRFLYFPFCLKRAKS